MDALETLLVQHLVPARRRPTLPHRVEHLQVMRPQDLSRPGRLGIVASMQPLHALSDRAMAAEAWGERVAASYAWNDIRAGGATLAFGSDAPVEPPNPFWGLHAAVNRAHWRGDNPWVPQQRIALAEALEAYTLGPAIAAGASAVSGALAVGCRADFTILDRNPFGLASTELHNLRASGTMVGGEWVYREF